MTGVEVPLSSSALRLRGRADRIRRVEANTYEICDYKSGTVLDEDGAVKDSIALQLRAYGLMFLESQPRAKLLLVVDIGKELLVPFDDAAREQAQARIEGLISALPTAGNRPMNEITKPGADCLGVARATSVRFIYARLRLGGLGIPEMVAAYLMTPGGPLQLLRTG